MPDLARTLISFVGDSISTFEGCNPTGYRVFYEGERRTKSGVTTADKAWWSHVARHFGARVLANASFSGSTVEGPAFPCGTSERRIADIAPEGTSPDDIVVFFGINDYGWGGFANMAAGRSPACPDLPDADLPEPAEARTAMDGEPEAFEKAYRSMLESFRAYHPKARVWCCTLLPGAIASDPSAKFASCLRGVPFDAYNDAIRKAADETGCRTVDLRAFGLSYDSLEGTHPTELGMRQLAAMVIRGMEASGAEILPLETPLEEALSCASASSANCDKATCIDCPYAVATGNAWLCLCRRP